MNNLMQVPSSSNSGRRRDRSDRGRAPQEFSQSSSHQSRSDPNYHSGKTTGTHRMTPAEERMTARLQQQQHLLMNQQHTGAGRLQSQQEGYVPRRPSGNRDVTRNSGSGEESNGYRTEAEARLASKMHQLRTSGGSPVSGNSTSAGGARSRTRASAPTSTAGSMIKVKTHYGSDIFVVAVSSLGCSHAELYTKIERKIRLCGAELPADGGKGLKMTYRDLDGDMIILAGDDDVESAFEVARMSKGRDSGVVNLFIQ